MVSVWNPYFQKDIDSIESAQKKATKIVKGIKYLEYSERLKRLDLTTPEQRRKRGDLIQIYKMINGLEKIELVNGINFASLTFSLRGHNLKIRRKLVKNCSPCYNFLTNTMEMIGMIYRKCWLK